MKATRKGNRFLPKPLFLMGMLALVAAFGLMVAGCDDGNDTNNNTNNNNGGGKIDSALVGAWNNVGGSGPTSITFASDGTVGVPSYNNTTAATSGTTLTITQRSQFVTTFTYEIQGTTLTISNESGNGSLHLVGTYTKQNANTGKSLKITGITLTGSVWVTLVDAISTSATMPAYGTGTVSSNQATIPLKAMNGSTPTDNNWTGSGEYYIMFWNTASPSGTPDYIAGPLIGKISFSGVETTVSWSHFSSTAP
jgi:hypothetical protein